MNDLEDRDADRGVELPLETPEIPGYDVTHIIGRGGMGTVFLAWQKRLRRPVAIKILPSALMRDCEAIRRFDREIRVVGKLNHPNIVTAYDANEYSGVHYLVMEYVDGITVASLSKRVGPLPTADACEIVRQVALGLQHAYRKGIVHRDIKPANLMLGARGIVKLLDMGLARLLSAEQERSDLTGTHQILGTLDYMSPEQALAGAEVDIRADIYSLGATLFQLLSGEAPLAVPSNESIVRKLSALTSGSPRSIKTLRPELPPALVSIVDRMLLHDAAERFAEPQEVADHLYPLCARSDLRNLYQTAEACPVEKAEFGAVNHHSLGPLPFTERRESGSSTVHTF